MIADVIRGLPGAVLVGLLPGLALAALVVPRWRWWERLIAGPGLSVGLAGVLGLVLHDLHLPFEPATVLPAEAALAAAAAVRLRRRGRAPRESRPGVLAAVGVGLVAGLAGATLVAAAQRDQSVPLGVDSAVHGAIAGAIATGHDSLAPVPDPAEATGATRPRTALEATAALVSELGGPDPARAMLPLGLLAVVVLPLALVALTLEGTGSARLALLAPLLAAGLPFPRVVVEFGGYPLLAESTLIVPLVLAAARVAAGRERAGGIVLAALAVASMWITHGTELLTAAAVGGPLVIAVLLRGGSPLRLGRAGLGRLGRRSAGLRGVGVLLVACAGAALVVSVLRRMPAVPTPIGSPLSGPPVSESDATLAPVAGLGLSGFWSGFSQYVFPAPALLLLYAAGIAGAVLRRQARWAVVAHLLLLGALADDVLWGHLLRVWTAVFPWSSRDRLGAIELWVLPLIMAVGLLVLADLAVRLLRRPGAVTGPRHAATGLAAVLAVLAAVGGLRHDADGYAAAVADKGLVTAADSTALARMSSTLPRGAVVLTDGTDDAGQWVAALTDQQAFFYKGYLDHHREDARIVALQRACTRPVDPALFRGLDAVFIGARRQHDATHPWSLPCLRGVAWLHPVIDVRAAGGEAVVFSVAAEVSRG